MPTFKITDKQTGKTYMVTAPPGTTPEQALARVRMQASSLTQEETQPKPQGPQRGFGENLLRTAGLGVRDAALSATDALGIVGNPVKYVGNQLAPDIFGPGTMSDDANQLMDMAGLPAPENRQERVISDVNRAIGGSMSMGGAGRLLAKAPGMIGMAGSGMAANPALQGASAATAGLAAGEVREEGAGWGPQLIAGLIGGMAPGGVMAGGRAARTLSDVMAERFTGAGAERRAAQQIVGRAERPGALVGDVPAASSDTRGFFGRTRDRIMGNAPPPNRPYVDEGGDPSLVPGHQRGLAAETQDPGLYPLERKLRSDNMPGWTQLDEQNNAAHIRAITGFAGDEESLKQLIKLRKDATEPLRKAARRLRGVDTSRVLRVLKKELRENAKAESITPTLNKLIKDMQRQIPQAERTRGALAEMEAYLAQRGIRSTADFNAAKEAMRQIRAGKSPVVAFSSQKGQEALKAASKKFHGMVAPEDRVRELDNVRREIGLMLSGKYSGDNALALKNSAELMKIKESLDKALEIGSPEMKLYLDTFRAMSKPVNRQQVGQYMMSEKSGGAVPDKYGQQQLTPASFQKLVRKPNTTASRATGFKKSKMAEILEPEDRAMLRNIAEDLRRRHEVATKATGGNSTTNQQGTVGKQIASGFLDRFTIPWVGPVIRSFTAEGDRRMSSVLNQMMQNPAKAREIIASLNAHEKAKLARAIKTHNYSTFGSAGQGAILAARGEQPIED